MVIEIPFRGVTAVPGSENPRRSRGFTIESLIGTDLERSSKRDSVCSQPAHHHSPLPPPPPPPPPPVGHVSSNGTLPSPLLPMGTNTLSSSSSSASSPSSSSSSSSSLSSSSVSPNGNHHHNHHTVGSSGSVTSSSSLTTPSLSSKIPLKCTVDHSSSHITHYHGKNNSSINNTNSYSGTNNNGRSGNNCSSSKSTTVTSHNNNNRINGNKLNSYNSTSRSPSPIISQHPDSVRSNSSNSNINSTTTNTIDDTNDTNGTSKTDSSSVNSRLLSVAHHYPQQTPLGLVTHSIEKSLLTEDKERFSHPQHHHSQQSHNQPQNYHHHHHHHHSPPIPGTSPVGATNTTGSNAGLHYSLKCAPNTDEYYRNSASGFTPVRLCNHPLGSAVTAAAAVAAAAAAGTPPAWTSVLPSTSPVAAAAAVNMSLYRDHALFNPWMFARCAGYLGHRYPGKRFIDFFRENAATTCIGMLYIDIPNILL